MKKLSITLTGMCICCCLTPAFSSPVNVANMYGVATANSSYQDRTPDKAIDGIVANDNLWNAGDHGTSSDPNWLIIDLGDLYTVTDIDLFFSPSDGKWAGFTTDYNLYYGSDNIHWNLIGSGQFVDEDPTKITDHYDLGSAGLEMQYVMYEVDGGTHWSSISEISVWADDGAGNGGGKDPVPEPVTIVLLGTGLAGLAGWKKRRTFHGNT